MHIDELRDYCLAKPQVEESTPFGPENLVFKVHGKIFLITDFESSPLQFNVKCDPEKAIELREEYSCVQPGYHMNKKHWNTIICDSSVSDQLIKEWINHSYSLVFKSLPKKTRG
jgi:predicted DNA-binding protein (MmcQ/YjbR family)